MPDLSDEPERTISPDDLDNPAAVETPRSRWEQESPRPESLRRPISEYCPRRVRALLACPDAGRIARRKLMVAGMRFPVNPCCASTARPTATATSPMRSGRATGL